MMDIGTNEVPLPLALAYSLCLHSPRDHSMAAVDSAPPKRTKRTKRTYRLTAASALLGLLLLLGSTFFPGIIRILYQSRVGCPDGPECPPPDIDASSFWEGWIPNVSGSVPLTLNAFIAFLVELAPFLAYITVQVVIAWRAWSGQLPRTQRDGEVAASMATMIIWGGPPRLALLKGGIVVTVVALVLFLGSSFLFYCFFFCGAGIPLPGEYHESTGLWQSSGVRYLAPGFWLALGGYLLSLITDLTLLTGARRTIRQSG
jgi:hypothetical protein